MSNYESIIRNYRHFRRQKKVITDPGTGDKALAYKSYPGGILAYYTNDEDTVMVYTLSVDSSGNVTSHRDQSVPWRGTPGTQVIRRFNDGLNTSLYGWYGIRDLIDYDSVKFEGESTRTTIKGTKGRVTTRSYLDGKWIYIEVMLDGSPVNFTQYGLKSPTLWAGIRTVTRDSFHRGWVSAITEFLRKEELVVEKSEDDLSIDFSRVDNLDYEYVAKSAVRSILGKIEDLKYQEVGEQLILTRSRNPIFKVTFDYRTGDMEFLNRKGMIFREDDSFDLTRSLIDLSNLADKIFANANYLKVNVETVSSIFNNLTTILETEEPHVALKHALVLTQDLSRGAKVLSSGEDLKVRLTKLYDECRTQAYAIVDTLTEDPSLDFLRSNRRLRVLINEAKELRSLLIIAYRKVVRSDSNA